MDPDPRGDRRRGPSPGHPDEPGLSALPRRGDQVRGQTSKLSGAGPPPPGNDLHVPGLPLAACLAGPRRTVHAPDGHRRGLVAVGDQDAEHDHGGED